MEKPVNFEEIHLCPNAQTHAQTLVSLEEINLCALMIEHMHRVMTSKQAKHGIPYLYLLNFVFNHLKCRWVPGTTKQMFIKGTLLECECMRGQTQGRSQDTVVLEQHATLKREVNDLTNNLNTKEVEISKLKSALQKAISSGPGTNQDKEEVLRKFRAENTLLLANNASLSEEIQTLNQQLIKAHEDANEQMVLLMCTFNHIPPLS